uniref:Uncharacterized protein n=1 Tax=Strombidinopsis acuminata TaxID=141414 RepID=A0A7S3X8K9_9SPIT|mmetsp:Transcript_8752/g.11605  ORF Transcript_8752/g.11605 Transcript_8752/m.11605 type:complete len:188 (+) Transcript_8752:162-725(+)
MKPAQLNKLITAKWRFFIVPSIVGYLYNFIFCLLAANFYSDWDRKLSCSGDGSITNPEENAATFDTILTLLFVFHFIEWIRCALLSTVMAVGTPVMAVWYGLGFLNVPFGLFVFLYAHAVRFGEMGTMCAAVQEYRGLYLLIDIICFWVLFVFLSCPILMIRCCIKKQNLSNTLRDADDDDEEEDDE